MRSCIRLSYLALAVCLACAAAPAWAQPAAADDPDALYRDREHAASAAAAERIWSERLSANPKDFESAWKLARARYWLGTNGPGTLDAKKAALERGIDAGRAAEAVEANKAEGYFWSAACMGALAEAHGLRQGIKYRGQIREALETARRLNAPYLDGSPDRALGRWYYKVPRLFGGDMKKSEQYLRAALAYKADSIISLLFLAETLIELDRTADAKAALAAAIAAPNAPDWIPEDMRFKVQAQQLLKTLR